MVCQFDSREDARNGLAPAIPALGIQLLGSVGRGGKNILSDVLTIQRALNLVPPSAGGPQPALQADGICGPLTIAAIGRFQQAQFFGALLDFRIDPNNRTVARLNDIVAKAPATVSSGGTRLGVVGGSGTVGGPGVQTTTADQMALARSLAPDAERRIVAAMDRLSRATAALALATRTPAQQQLVREIDFHFKASDDPTPAVHLTKIMAIYVFMLTAIREHNQGIRELFREGPIPDDNPDAIAFAALGGFFSFDQNDRFIFITPNFRTQSSGVIIHELGHFCGGNPSSGNDIVHRASPKPPPRGTKREDGSTDYAGMVPFHARTNVFSYQVYCFPEIPEFKVP